MMALIAATGLIGAVLARLFQVFVLIPACVVLLGAAAFGSAYLQQGWTGTVLDFAALALSLDIGFVFGLLAPVILDKWQRSNLRGKPEHAAVSRRFQ